MEMGPHPICINQNFGMNISFVFRHDNSFMTKMNTNCKTLAHEM
jgi:hypothetical protein